MNCTYKLFSTQSDIHPHLLKTVQRHDSTPYQRPIAQHQLDAFAQTMALVEGRSRPLIIDSGCGTGHSTVKLARTFPCHDVIGIDKSAHRLKKARPLDNVFFMRADLVDAWRLFASANLPIERHYLFYPNPWPKIGHLKRRFHGHPIFRTMFSLAPYFEARTNWNIYADELVMALTTLKQRPQLTLKADQHYITLFEKKYLAAGCEIFIIKNELIKNY